MKLIYLASPYSKYPEGREAAYKEVCKKAAELMNKVGVFCPIAHSHSVEIEGMNGNIKDGDWWLRQDFEILKRCDELWVYCMPSWNMSYGVANEIKFAHENNIPIKYLPYFPNPVPIMESTESYKQCYGAAMGLSNAAAMAQQGWNTNPSSMEINNGLSLRTPVHNSVHTTGNLSGAGPVATMEKSSCRCTDSSVKCSACPDDNGCTSTDTMARRRNDAPANGDELLIATKWGYLNPKHLPPDLYLKLIENEE